MRYLPVLLCLTLLGCIHRPTGSLALTPGTPAPTPQQVSSCESALTWHNVWTLLGAGMGGVAGAEGSIDAVTTNKTVQTGVGIGVAAAGVLAAISGVAAGIESSSYATGNCQVILSQSNAAATP
jgi:hypothetical protein